MNDLKFYAENYGCSSNSFDFEVMLGILSGYGFSISNKIEEASFILINTCGVKKPTEDRMINRINKLLKNGKPLIVSGCLPRISIKKIQSLTPPVSAILDPRSIGHIDKIVFQVLSGKENILFFSNEAINKLNLKRKRLRRLIDVIQISEGCLGECSYCCTKIARGRLKSYPIDHIVKSVTQSVNEGIREVRLSSQDLGVYGFDLDTNLIELLKKILSIPGDFQIRLGMMNPHYGFQIIDDLCEILNHPKLFKFLHIPVQSGSDRILDDMNRLYQQSEFKDLVSILRKKVKAITIATDIITGFPTESEEEFKETMTLIECTKPDIVNISKYHHRPGTIASLTLSELDPSIVSERTRVISKICNKISYESNLRMLSQKFKVFLVEVGVKGGLVGRTSNYKKVVLKEDSNRIKLGDKILLKIIKAHTRYLTGILIKR